MTGCDKQRTEREGLKGGNTLGRVKGDNVDSTVKNGLRQTLASTDGKSWEKCGELRSEQKGGRRRKESYCEGGARKWTATT